MFCHKCSVKESTGVIMILCGTCFDEFELLMEKNPKEAKKLLPKYLATEAEFRDNYAEYMKENPTESN